MCIKITPFASFRVERSEQNSLDDHRQGRQCNERDIGPSHTGPSNGLLHVCPSIAESASDAIIVANGEGNIIYWNQGAQTIFGYKEHGVVGQPISMLMPPRYKELHTKGLDRFKATGEAAVIGTTVELAGLRKDGSEFPLELSLSSWTAESEDYFAGIIRDISERKGTEEARRASEEMYRALFEQAADGIFVSSKDGQLVAANGAALKIFGFTKDEAIGSDVGQRFADPADRQRFRQRIGKGSITGFKVRLRRNDGTEIDVLLSATRLLDDEGKSLGVQGIVHDVTGRTQGVQLPDPAQDVSPSTLQGRQAPGQGVAATETRRKAGAPSQPAQVGNDPIGRDVLVGELELVIKGPVQPATVLKLHQWLQESANADVGRFSGRLDGDTQLNITISRPLPVDQLHSAPFVTDISEEPYSGADVLSDAVRSLGGVSRIGVGSSIPRRFRLILA